MIHMINQKVKDTGIQLAETRSVLTKRISFTPKNVSEFFLFLSHSLIMTGIEKMRKKV